MKIEEEVIINEQQAAFIEEEKEEITAEQIIEQELLKANLKPETPIVPPAENRKPTKTLSNLLYPNRFLKRQPS